MTVIATIKLRSPLCHPSSSFGGIPRGKYQAFSGGFIELCSAALKSCPIGAHCWALMYPTATPGWQCISLAPSHRDATCNPATGHGWDGVCLCAPCIGHTRTQTQCIKWWCPSSDQGMSDLGQEEEALCNLPKEPIPIRSRNLWLEALREAQWEAILQGLWGGKSGQVDLPQDPQSHVWTGRVLWPHLNFPGRWPRKQASWMLRYMRCRRLELTSWQVFRATNCAPSKPPKGTYSFSTW